MNTQDKMSKTNKKFKNNLYPNNKCKWQIDYFIAHQDMEADEVVTVETTHEMNNEYSNVFTAIECFSGQGWHKTISGVS